MTDKLTGAVTVIIDKHRNSITPMLSANGGAITRSALQNDAAVRTVAGYCYLMLPGLLRLAIREPTFVDFVMSHREKLLARLVGQPVQN